MSFSLGPIQLHHLIYFLHSFIIYIYFPLFVCSIVSSFSDPKFNSHTESTESRKPLIYIHVTNMPWKQIPCESSPRWLTRFSISLFLIFRPFFIFNSGIFLVSPKKQSHENLFITCTFFYILPHNLSAQASVVLFSVILPRVYSYKCKYELL